MNHKSVKFLIVAISRFESIKASFLVYKNENCELVMFRLMVISLMLSLLPLEDISIWEWDRITIHCHFKFLGCSMLLWFQCTVGILLWWHYGITECCSRWWMLSLLLPLIMTLLMTPVSLNVVPVDDEVEVFETDQDLVSFALQPAIKSDFRTSYNQILKLTK